MRKIHTDSKTGAKFIMRKGKKLYGAPMQNVLKSEGQSIPKSSNAKPKATNGRKPTQKKTSSNSSNSNRKNPTVTRLQKELDAANAKLARRKNSRRKTSVSPVGVREYYRSLPHQLTQQQQLLNRSNPHTRGRMVFNPEIVEEFIEVPEHLAHNYELFQGKEVDECILVEAPDYFPDEVWAIGEMPNIDYEAEKGHINSGELVHYTHKTGEEGGERPILCADEFGNFLIVGGDYEIHSEGIRN